VKGLEKRCNASNTIIEGFAIDLMPTTQKLNHEGFAETWVTEVSSTVLFQTMAAHQLFPPPANLVH
jgi:hypothetical protein